MRCTFFFGNECPRRDENIFHLRHFSSFIILPLETKGSLHGEIERTLVDTVLLLVTCWGELARAAEPPSDLCSLLPVAVLSKTLGQNYGAPAKTVAPRPFPNTNQGTDCTYKSGEHSFLFRVYVDPSASASADLFARLKSYFGNGSKDVSGVGDEAYLDKLGALHVRKGKVRYFLDGSRDSNKLNDLAIRIAAQL